MTGNGDGIKLDCYDQMREAVEVAARKVKKEPKTETPSEKFVRIREETESKRNKSVKRAAKSMVKKKTIRKMTSYFTAK